MAHQSSKLASHFWLVLRAMKIVYQPFIPTFMYIQTDKKGIASINPFGIIQFVNKVFLFMAFFDFLVHLHPNNLKKNLAISWNLLMRRRFWNKHNSWSLAFNIFGHYCPLILLERHCMLPLIQMYYSQTTLLKRVQSLCNEEPPPF